MLLVSMCYKLGLAVSVWTMLNLTSVVTDFVGYWELAGILRNPICVREWTDISCRKGLQKFIQSFLNRKQDPKGCHCTAGAEVTLLARPFTKKINKTSNNDRT